MSKANISTARGIIEELRRSLDIGALLLLAIFLVARPIANQYYSGEAAFAGLTAALLALCVGAIVILRPRFDRIYAPETLTQVIILWLGLHIFGLLRSPNFSAALAPAVDRAVDVVMLLCGYFLARQNPRRFSVIMRALVAIVVVEAFAGICQYWVDLPRLWRDVAAGREMLPEGLQSEIGLARFHSDNIFATFINPNSLAAYLLIGIWTIVGLVVDGDGDEKIYSTRRVFSGLLLILLLTALYFTNSKGAGVACAFGAWFFAAQRISARFPQYRRAIIGLTIAAFVGMLILLMLGIFGILDGHLFGQSLQTRFEYWKAALNMIAQHPFDGVGLNGFAENYPLFKTCLGEEVKDVHNDYLQLWVEMGIVAPLIYLMLWRLLLRVSPKLLRDDKSGKMKDKENIIVERNKNIEWLSIIGGVLAFAGLYCAFMPFNAASLINLLRGERNAENLYGALQTLALPIIFACVVIGLRERHATIGLQQGAKAAIGAVLTHQLVDFDLRISAVMSAIFLLGGMLLALNERRVEERTYPTLPERWSRAFLPLLAVALIPGAVWFGLTSGVSRRAAEDIEKEARDLSSQTADCSSLPRYRELRHEALALRRQAAEASPFDADAWLELASACSSLTSADSVTENHILHYLRAAERLRPLSFIPKLQLANFYMRRNITGDLEKARQAYAAAAARYPLHPGIRLWTGDALLLQGQLDAAAIEYLEAFKIDLRIGDGCVRLSNAFIDPCPGVFARHSCDDQVFAETTRRLNSLTQEKSNSLRRALLLRRLLTLAWLINETERTRATLTPIALERICADLTQTAESLVLSMTDLSERAHAALLLALSWQMRGSQKSSDAAKQAWRQARALQQQSVECGAPGTPPDIFERLASAYLN